jgi:exopolysaccharide production protein ExoQ
MTLTTRTDIWPILLEYQPNPVLGAGFNSFWAGSRMVELASMTGGIIQAHNGYLEIYLNGGAIGVGLLVILLVWAYARTKKELVLGTPASSIAFVFLFVAIVYNFSEASFNKQSLLWIVTIFAVMGYRAPSVPWQAVEIEAIGTRSMPVKGRRA